MANINNTRGCDGCPVNFISWNVKSLNHPVKFKKIFSHLKQLNVDIAFLQETHIRSCDSSRLVRGWAGQVYQSNFCSKVRGVAIMISKNVQFTVSHVQTDSAGRYVIVVGKLCTLPVILACIHHLILGGDINCALSPLLDRSISRRASLSKSAHSIQLFLRTYGVADVWRFRNPTSRAYSYFSPIHKTYSRIDYFFLDKRILHLTKECDYGAMVISDHGPLIMKMYIPNTINIPSMAV